MGVVISFIVTVEVAILKVLLVEAAVLVALVVVVTTVATLLFEGSVNQVKLRVENVSKLTN